MQDNKGKHLDWTIFDDPMDLMDEFSPTLIGRVKKVYENLSSIADKGVIIVGQPVTENDLYDFLKKSLLIISYLPSLIKIFICSSPSQK